MSRPAVCPHCGWMLDRDDLPDASPAQGWDWCPRCNGDRRVTNCPTCHGKGVVRLAATGETQPEPIEMSIDPATSSSATSD